MILYRDGFFGKETRDSKCHSNPVVTKGIDFPAPQGLIARNPQTVRVVVDDGSEWLEIRSNGPDTIALLRPQFRSISDADSIPGARCQNREYWNLVNNIRDP